MRNSCRWICIFVVVLLAAACSPPEPGELSLEVLSGRAYLVTGGSALIEVRQTGGQASLQLELNGERHSGILQRVSSDSDTRRYRGLVTELEEGENTLVVRAGETEASLGLVNYPLSGPLISGPRQEPYFCLPETAPDEDGESRRFAIGNGEYLDTSAMNENCSVATRVDHVYRSESEEEFLPLPEGGALPDDVMQTTTSDGREVPYIVRLETGSINRAIYQIAILHDPRSSQPHALNPPPAWNERLVYTFGGGCEAGFFQGESTGGVLRDMMLSQGYAVASSTLNVNAQGGCNDVLSAETAMMVKEHFSEHYGVPRYTIGRGGSGGAMQQLLIAGAYPGILDGLLPSLTFSDALTYFVDAQECSGPLRDYLNERDPDDEVKAAIGGWPDWSLCNESLGQRPDRIAPYDCPSPIPPRHRYHAEDNPDGVRCSIYDGMRNIFGEKLYPAINEQRPFARSPHDNVGVQYGLEALNEGLINKELFLDLNEQFGGWDIDYQPTEERTQGDEQAIRAAYETGRVVSGGAGLARVPIIDDRPYLDDEGNFHASVYSFTTRARLVRDNGHADNYVIRRHDPEVNLAEENLAMMDRWLQALHGDDSNRSWPEKIVEARPEGLRDDCFTSDGERIEEAAVFDRENLFDNSVGRCGELYPPHAGLRLVAGGPLSNDVLKCRLKPIDSDDYAVSFTEDERQRLEAIFPDGVCDWSLPGLHQTVNETWLSFGPSPVNRYRPEAD